MRDFDHTWLIFEAIAMLALLALLIGLLIALNAVGSRLAECWYNASKCPRLF